MSYFDKEKVNTMIVDSNTKLHKDLYKYGFQNKISSEGNSSSMFETLRIKIINSLIILFQESNICLDYITVNKVPKQVLESQ